jgi:WD40 repeat protein
VHGDSIEDEASEGSDRGRVVDARAARGVQIGDHNTQVIYSYHGTWTDGVAPAPLIGVAGEVESPYRGLGWFSERDAPFFFGRDTAIDDLLQRLSQRVQQPGILLVSGVSGAGKSSLLRAGVLPRIRGQGLPNTPEAYSWPCLVLTAGHDPLDELALSIAQVARLDAATTRRELRNDPAGFAVIAAQAAQTVPTPPGGGRCGLLLVVDQFEQLFTQCPDESQRRAFITALHAAATTRRADTVTLVVLVVRADVEFRCGDYELLIDAFQHHYLVTAMTERQLRMAIAEPAKQAGSRIDDDLAEQLLRETRGHAADSGPATVSAAGVLPLLSYALDRTWRLRRGDTVTVADYERAGGLGDAVAESAQRAYGSLTAPQRRAARRVFLRLVVSGPDGVDTADRVGLDDLAWDGVDSGDVDAVLVAFTEERLLTIDARTVEISHEVLLTTWPLLRDTWLAETRDHRAVIARLRIAAAEWASSCRDPAHLYSGSVLHTATSSAAQTAADPARYPSLGATEIQFLAASTRAQRRRVRRRRAVTGVLMFLVVALTAATLVVFRANQNTIEQRDRAVARELIADSERRATSDPFGSRISALAAWRIEPTDEARYALLAALHNPATARFTTQGAVQSVALSPDGATLAGGSFDGSVQLWDVAGNRPLGNPLTGHSSSVNTVVFSPDGSTLAVGNEDGSVRLWDVADRQLIGEPLAGHAGAVRSLAFSPGGTILAVGSTTDDGSVQLWEVEGQRPMGAPLVVQASSPGMVSVLALTFSPDGETLTSSGSDGSVRVWNVAGRRLVEDLLAGRDHFAESVTLSPDGKTLASGSSTVYDESARSTSGAVRLWDVEGNRPLDAPFPGVRFPYDMGLSVVFSPDGKILAVGSGDGSIWLWDMEGDRPLGEPLVGHSNAVNSMVFSRDGETLATGSGDGSVRLWSLAGRRPMDAPLTGHNESVLSLALGPDGETLATGSDNGSVQLWDQWEIGGEQRNGDPLVGHNDSVVAVSFSPDGKILASGGYDDSVRLWDIEGNRPLDAPPIEVSFLSEVALGPGGKLLAVGFFGTSIELWDREDNRPLNDPFPNTPFPTFHMNGVSLAFDPGGKILAVGAGDGSVWLWDVEGNRQFGNPLTGALMSVGAMAFSPDGKILAVGSNDGSVRLWDVKSQRPLGDLFIGHRGQVLSVVFGPDGKTLAAAINDAKLDVWEVGFTVDPAASLCALIPTSLTSELWDEYVPSDSGPEGNLCP